MKSKKLIGWLVAGLILSGLGFWIFRTLTKPLPGEEVADMGRDHVNDIAGIVYSSNPPASGPHFPVWAKKGVYDRLISDGYLIHSLEHGYIILSYDCSKPVSEARGFVTSVLAHDEPVKESTDSGQFLKHMKIAPQGDMSWFSPQNPPEVEIPLPDSFQTESCKSLVAKLSELAKTADRVIVVPRVGMDTPIAVTAWNRILKLNNVEETKIREFIEAFHNRGPEATTE